MTTSADRDSILSQLHELCTFGMFDELEKYVLRPYNGAKRDGAVTVIPRFEEDFREWWLDPLMEEFKKLDTELLEEVLNGHRLTSEITRGIHYASVASGTPLQKFMSFDRNQIMHKWEALAGGDFAAAVHDAMSFHNGRDYSLEAFNDVCTLMGKPLGGYHLLEGRQRRVIEAMLIVSSASWSVFAANQIRPGSAHLTENLARYLKYRPERAIELSQYMLECDKAAMEVDHGYFDEWRVALPAFRSGAL